MPGVCALFRPPHRQGQGGSHRSGQSTTNININPRHIHDGPQPRRDHQRASRTPGMPFIVHARYRWRNANGRAAGRRQRPRWTCRRQRQTATATESAASRGVPARRRAKGAMRSTPTPSSISFVGSTFCSCTISSHILLHRCHIPHPPMFCRNLGRRSDSTLHFDHAICGSIPAIQLS